MKVSVFEDPHRLAGAAAEEFARRAREAVERTGSFTVALAGGSTPRETYRRLAEEYATMVEWSRVHFFFGDERGVPPGSEDSNYRMASEALLSRVPAGGVHRIRGERPPEEAAALYEAELHRFFGVRRRPPKMDLILLGLGDDGHTASLFPKTPALRERRRWVVANPVEKLSTTRITLTLPVINAARAVMFLVAGEGKAKALKMVLEENADPAEYPARLVRPAGELIWMVDRAAASLLERTAS
ncbi:MAG: 6-phosphogluconolactonase [Rubrobacteraceae bacterium]|nr:6-phosphogluconolactonase [Rubrobacteraceae bacterium]MCL6438433.1 6-phosphogluconolactonase [Rubrobacteraceae bacterium]